MASEETCTQSCLCRQSIQDRAAMKFIATELPGRTGHLPARGLKRPLDGFWVTGRQPAPHPAPLCARHGQQLLPLRDQEGNDGAGPARRPGRAVLQQPRPGKGGGHRGVCGLPPRPGCRGGFRPGTRLPSAWSCSATARAARKSPTTRRCDDTPGWPRWCWPPSAMTMPLRAAISAAATKLNWPGPRPGEGRPRRHHHDGQGLPRLCRPSLPQRGRPAAAGGGNFQPGWHRCAPSGASPAPPWPCCRRRRSSPACP
jgi:hypothetical protein